jgi:hypothetical protein
MRTLKFIVEDQIIRPDPNCDFSNLVPGTKGYLKAEFSFSTAWDGFVKVAGFYSVMGREYKPQILSDGKSCIIPADACARPQFKIQILGKRGVDVLKTNKLTVSQNGGGV